MAQRFKRCDKGKKDWRASAPEVPQLSRSMPPGLAQRNLRLSPQQIGKSNNRATLNVESFPRINSVWVGHSCPTPLTLILHAALPIAESSDATPPSISVPEAPADPARVHPTRSLQLCIHLRRSICLIFFFSSRSPLRALRAETLQSVG